MKLLKLRMVNYRRFTGEVEIEFANKKNQNVTIIRAENGAGKTGIMTALLFGLFGQTEYNQFNISSESDDIIINRKILKQNGNASATVTIEFVDDNTQYEIERTIQGTCVTDILSQDSEAIKSKLTENGLLISEDTDEINENMNNRIGEHIRGFLFFDGVKYVNLFQRDYKQYKKELQKIIERLLNIKDLDDTISQINSIENKYNSNNGNSKYARQIAEQMNSIQENTSKLNEKNIRIEQEELKLSQVEKDELKLKAELEKFQEYKEKFDEIKSIRAKIDESKQRLDTITQTSISETDKAYRELFRNTIGLELREELQSILSNEESISKSLIQAILNSKKCICGNEVKDKETTELQNLLSTIDSGERIDIDYIVEIRKIYDELTLTDPSYQTFFSDTWESINQILEEIENLEKRNKNIDISIDELLKKQDELGNTRGAIKQRKETLNTVIDQLTIDIKDLEETLVKLGVDLEDTKQLQAMEQGELDKYRFFSNTRKKLKKMRDNYLLEAQENISLKSNEFFKKLLSKDDQDAIKELKINKDYRIQAFDNNGDEIFPQLSAGQKHLAAMAFTMGLTAVSTEAKPDSHFPLVMDTPLSNLDLANRKRLISLMPQIVSQWILTPMDTEMTRSEIEFFIQTNSVGKVYELLKNEDETSLKEYTTLQELKGGMKNGRL